MSRTTALRVRRCRRTRSIAFQDEKTGDFTQRPLTTPGQVTADSRQVTADSREQPASFGLPGHPIAPFELTNINFYVMGMPWG
jgi:hypothetical protein